MNETLLRYKNLSDFEKNLYLKRQIKDLQHELSITKLELGMTISERDEARDTQLLEKKRLEELAHLRDIIRKRKVIMHNLKLDIINLKRENKKLLSQIYENK